MAKKKPKTEYYSKLGKIPPENFDNDIPIDPKPDKSEGSLYDKIKKKIKDAHQRIVHLLRAWNLGALPLLS